jgi:Zn-finger nucleic acid-binding protein
MSVARLFLVTCPRCRGKFPCHYEDLRHKPYKLLCPFCGCEFHQEESPEIEE